MKQRRKLGDLYVRGRDVTVDDGDGPVTVWLQKLNAVEQDQARRKAAAARARVLMHRNAVESEAYQEVYSEATDFGDTATLIEYLLQDDLYKKHAATEAELAAEEEWSKDDYLEGLRDSWENEGFKERYALDPEDADPARVFSELKRFSEKIDVVLKGEAVHLRKDYEGISSEELFKRVVEKFMSTRSDMAWVEEYRKCEIWLSTRDPAHHRTQYFTDRQEVDLLADEVYVALTNAYQEMSVDAVTGKDLPDNGSSSPSAEPSGPVETVPSSGHLTAVL